MSKHELNPATLNMLVHEFYDLVRQDQDLQPIFDKAIGENWDLHLSHMVDFWSTVMLGSRQFQGNVYGKHMLLNGIEAKHFEQWLKLFKNTAYHLFDKEIADEISTVAHRIAGSLQYGFFGKIVVQ